MSTIIRTENLGKDYGGGRGLRDLTMELSARTIFGYIGPNGSGKTTTIKLLCGLVNPSRGRAWIDGMEVLPRNILQIKRMIGYLPDEFGVYEQMSVWEYLDFFGAAYKIPVGLRRKRIYEVLELTDATHMLDYQVSSLSRGMHQKIGIAKTLLHDPTILILDEPANGLDPYARIEMRNTILRLKEIGKTVMLSSHILPELGTICDEVGIIEKGTLLIQGSLAEITHSLQEHIQLLIQVDSDVDVAAKVLKDVDNNDENDVRRHITNVLPVGNEIRVDYQGKRNEVADLTVKLIESNVRVLFIKEIEVDLENVFLAVTGHMDKDEGDGGKDALDPGRGQRGETGTNGAAQAGGDGKAGKKDSDPEARADAGARDRDQKKTETDADSAMKDAKPDVKGDSKADMTGIRKNGEEAKAEDGKKQDPVT